MMVSNATQVATIIIIFAILIQFCVDRIKDIVGERIMSYIKAPVWSLLLGILLALTFDIDIFAIIGYTSGHPIVSKVITGIILSSGSTPVHELLAKIRESRF